MKFTKWIFVQIMFFVLLYYGFIGNVVFAKNIFLFVCWVNILCSMLLIIPAITKSARDKGPSVNKYLSITVGVVEILSVAGLGMFVLASFMVVGDMFQYSVFYGDEKE